MSFHCDRRGEHHSAPCAAEMTEVWWRWVKSDQALSALLSNAASIWSLSLSLCTALGSALRHSGAPSLDFSSYANETQRESLFSLQEYWFWILGSLRRNALGVSGSSHLVCFNNCFGTFISGVWAVSLPTVAEVYLSDFCGHFIFKFYAQKMF